MHKQSHNMATMCSGVLLLRMPKLMDIHEMAWT